MEVMENVPDGEGYEAWRRLSHAQTMCTDAP